MFTLRPYQQAAVSALAESDLQRPAVLLPTGMGKTVIFSSIIASEHAAGRRSLTLVHRDELATQALAKVAAMAPGVRTGLVKAASDQHGPEYDAVVASVQTLARAGRRARVDPYGFDRIIVDECHHAAAQSYLDVLEHFGAFDKGSGTRAYGFTATMSREDSRGLGDVWEDIVYTQDIRYGIRCGYLCDIEGRSAKIEGFNLATVKRSHGDYDEADLGRAMLAADAGPQIAAALKECATGPDGQVRRTLLFAPTVETTERFTQDLREAGIPADMVIGATTREERQAAFERFRTGETRVLVNCMVLTEGFDAPWAEVCAIARPTSSRGLFVQMAGRVLRPWQGKERALLLDLAGSTRKGLKLSTLADLSTTPVTIDDGESLDEAMARAEEEELRGDGDGAGQETPDSVGGRLRIGGHIDLFAESHSAWLQTRKGKWFLSVSGAASGNGKRPEGKTIFIWPEFGNDAEPGTYRVGVCGVYAVGRGEWPYRNLPLELAMSMAEDIADRIDPHGTTARRAASWRKRGGAPSMAQTTLATRLGIDPTGMNKAQLSDAISIHYASRLLDR